MTNMAAIERDHQQAFRTQYAMDAERTYEQLRRMESQLSQVTEVLLKVAAAISVDVQRQQKVLDKLDQILAKTSRKEGGSAE